jgi:nitrite reductase (NADH) small subunit
MQRHVVSSVADLPEGATRIVEVTGRSIGVLNVDGELYAVRNVCPHHGAPLCLGPVSGTMLPSEPHEYVYQADATIIRCPWHGYEFELATGRSVVGKRSLAVKTYRVAVEDDEVVLYA